MFSQSRIQTSEVGNTSRQVTDSPGSSRVGQQSTGSRTSINFEAVRTRQPGRCGSEQAGSDDETRSENSQLNRVRQNARKSKKRTLEAPNLISEEEYIRLKKENVLLQNQRLQREAEDHQVESHILHLNRVHKELQIEETKARIKMYEAITRAAEKKARLEIHLTPSSQVKDCLIRHLIKNKNAEVSKEESCRSNIPDSNHVVIRAF